MCQRGCKVVGEVWGGWMEVNVSTGVRRDGGRWGGKVSNDLAVVLRYLGSRNPSEWSVCLGFHLSGPLCLGFHLNVPLSRWTGKCVGDAGGVLEAPTLGSIGFRFSRVPPATFSAAHTDLEYSENHARDGGPPSHCIYVATGSTDFGQP